MIKPASPLAFPRTSDHARLAESVNFHLAIAPRPCYESTL